MSDTLLEIKNLSKTFDVRKGVLRRSSEKIRAVSNVSLSLQRGETLALVGESGCGKSTLGKTLLQLSGSYEGEVLFSGTELSNLTTQQLRTLRQDMQIIFQDPMESLNSRHTVGQILREPLDIHKLGKPEERDRRVDELLALVGLNKDCLSRFPHEFSGGQRQRIGIARAIALEPKFIVCDEPVSALDVSIQSQIINLLLELQNKLNLTLLFISHDLSVVRHIADRVAVMYLGEIVELGTAEELFNSPRHPYTRALLDAIPVPDPTLRRGRPALLGDVPSVTNPPSGCCFHPRCVYADDSCKNTKPALEKTTNGEIRCLHWQVL